MPHATLTSAGSHCTTPQHEEAQTKVTTLQTDRATVEELLAKRAAAIAAAAALLRFNAEYQEAADLVASKLEEVKAVELPRDAAAAAPLLAQLQEIKADAEANDDKIKAATASGTALIKAEHPESAEVQRKLDALVAERAALGKGTIAVVGRRAEGKEEGGILGGRGGGGGGFCPSGPR